MTASSWKKQHADRRDERATKAPDAPTKKNAKKDTKRWCRGKEGVEHKARCRNYDDVKGPLRVSTTIVSHHGWKLLVCDVCGKELDFYYPFGRAKKNPPDWVEE